MTFDTLISNPTYLGYLWLIIGIIFLMLEVGAPGLFYFVSLAIGAFAAAATAFLGYSLYAHCAIALIGSVASLLILKNIFFTHKKQTLKTNIEALIGQEAIVTHTIEPHKPGRVKVGGEEWPALAEQHQIVLHPGTVVFIRRIEGNKIIVTRGNQS